MPSLAEARTVGAEPVRRRRGVLPVQLSLPDPVGLARRLLQQPLAARRRHRPGRGAARDHLPTRHERAVRHRAHPRRSLAADPGRRARSPPSSSPSTSGCAARFCDAGRRFHGGWDHGRGRDTSAWRRSRYEFTRTGWPSGCRLNRDGRRLVRYDADDRTRATRCSSWPPRRRTRSRRSWGPRGSLNGSPI